MNSSVRLGVSPTAVSTPTGVFNQRFESLFPLTGTLGCEVYLILHLFLLVYLHANVRPLSPQAAARWACQLPPCHESSPSGCLSPPLLPVWMNVSSLSPWSSDFHAVRFSVSSGCFLFLNCCCPSFACARRHSVSTYTSILAGSLLIIS